jgi:hypothetical protein
VHAELTPVIAATAQWLTRAYPASGGAHAAALCEAQARQAVTVAARLRYPTAMDAALAGVAGPGGSARLDRLAGADDATAEALAEQPWRSWVDETVASWAACLLGDPGLADRAVAALGRAAGAVTGLAPTAYRRLLAPNAGDRRAAVLLRHPDLLAPVAALHRTGLLTRLTRGPALAA